MAITGELPMNTQLHPSVKRALTAPPSLTPGELRPIWEAVASLQSLLSARSSLSHFEVALLPSAQAKKPGQLPVDPTTWLQTYMPTPFDSLDFVQYEPTTNISAVVANCMERPNVACLLAAEIMTAIERSGAAKTEVYAALGVVQSLLPTLEISTVTEDV